MGPSEVCNPVCRRHVNQPPVLGMTRWGLCSLLLLDQVVHTSLLPNPQMPLKGRGGLRLRGVAYDVGPPSLSNMPCGRHWGTMSLCNLLETLLLLSFFSTIVLAAMFVVMNLSILSFLFFMLVLKMVIGFLRQPKGGTTQHT